MEASWPHRESGEPVTTVDKRSDTPKVSIIVPMYKVEKYIRNCVESLMGQTLVDIEIVLVDDGSPDTCGEIADAYARKDARIKVIHQQNSGLGPARNSGMAASSGEYVGFVDGDDWVAADMYQKLYGIAVETGADIVVGGHSVMRDGNVVKEFHHPLAGKVEQEPNEIDAIRKQLYGHAVGDKQTESFPVTVCTNLYKKTFVKDNHLRFKEIMSEDTIFNLMAYKCAKKISFTNGVDYCYRKDGQSSITSSLSPKVLDRYCAFIDCMHSMADKELSDRDDCIDRVNHAAVEYSRLYGGLVASSGLVAEDKLQEMERLVSSRLFSVYAKAYPSDALPAYARMYQSALLRGNYKQALRIVGLRNTVRSVEGWLHV